MLPISMLIQLLPINILLQLLIIFVYIIYTVCTHTYTCECMYVSYIKASKLSEVCQEEAEYTVLTLLFAHMNLAFIYLPLQHFQSILSSLVA